METLRSQRKKMIEEIKASGGDTQVLAEIASRHRLPPGVVEVWKKIPLYLKAWGMPDRESGRVAI